MYRFFSALSGMAANNTHSLGESSNSEPWNTSTVTAIAVSGTAVITLITLCIWDRYQRNQHKAAIAALPPGPYDSDYETRHKVAIERTINDDGSTHLSFIFANGKIVNMVQPAVELEQATAQPSI